MADPQTIGEQFVAHFYNVFDGNRDQVAGLYNDESMLSFEGTSYKGAKAIMVWADFEAVIQHVVIYGDQR